jgi:hypothetical protein
MDGLLLGADRYDYSLSISLIQKETGAGLRNFHLKAPFPRIQYDNSGKIEKSKMNTLSLAGDLYGY